MKVALLILFCCAFLGKNITWGQEDDKVTITLFYEVLCPYCIEFITKQLYPTVNTLNLSNKINLDLVPYGNAHMARHNGKWSFTCQHGEEECYGNKIHACALEQSKTKEQTKIMEIINCFTYSDYKDEQIKKCCQKSKYNYNRLKRCMLTEANDLLAQFGNRTEENVPKVKYVPFIMLDDYHNETLNDLARADLKQVLCSMFKKPVPDICNKLFFEQSLEYIVLT